ncbi:hypothetical protein LTR95_001815 [Oleoguttula sp. CCFEE 5521]
MPFFRKPSTSSANSTSASRSSSCSSSASSSTTSLPLEVLAMTLPLAPREDNFNMSEASHRARMLSKLKPAPSEGLRSYHVVRVRGERPSMEAKKAVTLPSKQPADVLPDAEAVAFPLAADGQVGHKGCTFYHLANDHHAMRLPTARGCTAGQSPDLSLCNVKTLAL